MTDELMEDLEVSSMDALRGDPPGPAVAARVDLAVRQALARHGHADAKVEVTSDRRGTNVLILLRKPDRTVERVVFALR